MIGISAYGDAAYVSQLWDLSLKSAWEVREQREGVFLLVQ